MIALNARDGREAERVAEALCDEHPEFGMAFASIRVTVLASNCYLCGRTSVRYGEELGLGLRHGKLIVRQERKGGKALPADEWVFTTWRVVLTDPDDDGRGDFYTICPFCWDKLVGKLP